MAFYREVVAKALSDTGTDERLDLSPHSQPLAITVRFIH